MNRQIKNLMFASLSLISAHNALANTVMVGIGDSVVLQRGNDDSGTNHPPHRTRAQKAFLPEVYYDFNAKTLTYSSSSAIDFVYNIYGEDGFVVSQGIVNLEENQDTTIPIPAGVEGECTITLEINGQTYWGTFYI